MQEYKVKLKNLDFLLTDLLCFYFSWERNFLRLQMERVAGFVTGMFDWSY